MFAEALEQILAWEPARIQAYCAALTGELVREARELGFGVEEEGWRGAHLFGLRMPEGVEAMEVQAALARRRVVVSVRGSGLRISPNVYNDAEDVAALLEVLREVA